MLHKPDGGGVADRGGSAGKGWGTRKNTVRGYQIHIEKYLIPHLGRIPLDRLRVATSTGMIAAIADDVEAIPVEQTLPAATSDGDEGRLAKR